MFGNRFFPLLRSFFVAGIILPCLTAPIALGAPAMVAGGSGPLAVAIESRAIVARGATANGRVLFVGFTRTYRGYATVSTRHTAAVTADADGTARLTIDRDVAPASFWAAIGLTDATFGVTAPAATPLREMQLSTPLKNSSAGVLNRIVAHLPYVYVVLVRPNISAWDVTVGDGGTADRDGALDGKVEIDTGDFKSLDGRRPPPEGFERGDLVMIVDPDALRYFVTRVGN